ncbi:MAG: molybdenum ABC transporter ATP-binding protein [Nitrospinota bacterium]
MIDLAFEVWRPRFRLDVELRSEAQVTGLFGPSGAGKTTILHAVAGILRPARGRVAVGGRTFFDSASGVSLPPESRRVGMVFQENHLFPHLDVKGNLLFGYRRTPAARRRLQPEEIVELLGLGELLPKRPGQLSGGEARRVAIGRALLTSPDLLVLDEPLTGLDRRLRNRILAYLIRLKRKLGVPILYVSHSFSDMAALADRVALLGTEEAGGLRRSRVIKAGPALDLLEDAAALSGAGPFETIFRGEVVEVRPDLGYATVRAGGLTFHAPLEEMEAGARAIVTLRADEALLATGPVPRVSARNVWTGRVARIHRLESRRVVEVDVGQSLLAEVTEGAIQDLGIREGSEVHVLAKTRSLRVTALPAGLHIGGD